MYEDSTVSADETGITIAHYGLLGTEKRVPYAEIESVEVFDMQWGGRWRVFGLGPTGWSNWYNWDSQRRKKTTAIAMVIVGLMQIFYPAALRKSLQ